MDIVEFVKSEYGVELFDWQKEYLRTLDRIYENCDARIVVIPRGVGRMFTYFKLKELVPNGKTYDREQ